MATKRGGDGWGLALGLIGTAIAVDSVAKKQTAIDRLTLDSHAKDGAIRALRSQLTNAQAVQSNEQRLRIEAQNLARQVAAERDDAKRQLSEAAMKLSAETMAKVNAMNQAEAMKKRVAELEADIARLKPPPAK